MDEKKKFNTIRLKTSHNYKRPSKTITDNLQDPEAYRKKLEGYVEVSDIDYVTISTHVRYFIYSLKEKKWLFRTGGLLTKKHEKYVVLSNGKYSWSVQRNVRGGASDENIYETKFFKIMNSKDKQNVIIDNQAKEIEILKNDNKILSEKLNLLLSKFSHMN